MLREHGKMEETKKMLSNVERKNTLETLQKLSLTSDVLFTACMRDNIPAVQRILRIILNDDKLVVKEVRVQEEIRNVFGRSVCLDVLAYLKGNDLVNIEMQAEAKGAHPKRLRYNASLIDASRTIQAGQDFPELQAVYIIFIDVNNAHHSEKAISHYAPADIGNGEVLDEMGLHYLYVNGKYSADDALGVLISDLHQTTSDQIQTPELKECVHRIKETEKGRDYMCEIMENYAKDYYAKGSSSTLFSLVKKGLITISDAAQELSMSVEECQKLFENYMARNSAL